MGQTIVCAVGQNQNLEFHFGIHLQLVCRTELKCNKDTTLFWVTQQKSWMTRMVAENLMHMDVIAV